MPKLKGQIEFLRPQDTRSCTRDRTTLRRTASSNVLCSFFDSSRTVPGLVMDHRIRSLLLFGTAAPIECADTPEIQHGCGEDSDKYHRFPERGPPKDRAVTAHANRNTASRSKMTKNIATR